VSPTSNVGESRRQSEKQATVVAKSVETKTPQEAATPWGKDLLLERNQAMSSDPKSNVSQNPLCEVLDKEIDHLLALGLENFSVRELLGMMLSAAGQAERQHYLAQAAGDKGNGGYERALNVGSIPVEVQVPRTRSGNFRPRTLPPPYQRGYSEEVQALLLLLTAQSAVYSRSCFSVEDFASCLDSKHRMHGKASTSRDDPPSLATPTEGPSMSMSFSLAFSFRFPSLGGKGCPRSSRECDLPGRHKA
jgi:hypothetical protein